MPHLSGRARPAIQGEATHTVRTFSIASFLGPVTGIDSRALSAAQSSDQRNLTTEDGTLTVRKGFRNIVAAQSGFAALYGMSYLQGYSGTTEVEEYGSVENLGVANRPYTRHVTTGAPTVLTNAGASVSLNASDWVMQCYNGDSYWLNPNDTVPVYRHTIGTNNSFTPIVTPAAPTVRLSYSILYGGGTTPYSQLSFAGIDVTTEIAYTGSAHATNSSVPSDNSIIIGHAQGNVDSSFKVDLNGATAGVADWSYNDIFGFALGTTAGLTIDWSSVTLTLINNDGSPATFTPTKLERVQNTGVFQAPQTVQYFFRAEWVDKGEARALWDNVRYFKISYKIIGSSGTAANNLMYLGKPYIGGVQLTPPWTRDPNQVMTLAYSYYYSAALLESGLSPIRQIPVGAIQGLAMFQGLDPLGCHLTLTNTTSGDANVDNNRFYVQDDQGLWRLIVTQSDAGTTYAYKLSWPEALRLTQYTPSQYTYTGVTNACGYKGSMVWFYQGGYQNVRFSRVGSPEQLASLNDDSLDTARGATFSLADNLADEPLGGLAAGDSLIIFGKYGVHAMTGQTPSSMSPPRKVPGSYGCAGKFAFCKFHDDMGRAGGAYLSRDGQVYFVLLAPVFSGDAGSAVAEISAPIRTGACSLRTFLLDGQPLYSFTDFSTARMWVDEATDSLWVAMGRRALVFRKPSLSDGNRHWEPYEYEAGSATTAISYVAASTKRRVRWMRSNGKFDEAEWNSATGAFITGSLRDGGAAIPGGTIYWQSHIFVGPNRRLNALKCVRDTYTNTPTLTSYSSQTPGGLAVLMTSGNHSARFTITANGTEHYYRIAMSEADDPVRRLEVEEVVSGRNRNR